MRKTKNYYYFQREVQLLLFILKLELKIGRQFLLNCVNFKLATV